MLIIIKYSTEEDLYNLLVKLKPDIRIPKTDYKNKKFTGDNLNIKRYYHHRNHDFSTTILQKKE